MSLKEKERRQVQSHRAKEAAQLFGCGESTIWHWNKTDPKFPRARRFGARFTCWDLDELIAYRDAHTAEAEAA